MKKAWEKKVKVERPGSSFQRAMEVLGQVSYSLGRALSTGHEDYDTGEKSSTGNPILKTIWHMPVTPGKLLEVAYENGIAPGYDSNAGLTVEGSVIGYGTSGGTRMEIAPIWNLTDYPYIDSWRLRIWANPGGTLEAACQGAGFEQVEQEDNEEEEQ